MREENKIRQISTSGSLVHSYSLYVFSFSPRSLSAKMQRITLTVQGKLEDMP
jgi:hypothetical protein